LFIARSGACCGGGVISWKVGVGVGVLVFVGV
jgi:hypothetical protein